MAVCVDAVSLPMEAGKTSEDRTEPPVSVSSSTVLVKLATLAASQNRIENMLADIFRGQHGMTQEIGQVRLDLTAIQSAVLKSASPHPSQFGSSPGEPGQRKLVAKNVAVEATNGLSRPISPVGGPPMARAISPAPSTAQEKRLDYIETSDPGASASLRPTHVAALNSDGDIDEQRETHKDHDQGVPGDFVAPTLPLSWPGVLDLRDGFDAQMKAAQSSRVGLEASGSVRSGKSNLDLSKVDDSPLAVTGCVRRWILVDPNSVLHMFFDLVSLAILFYDLTVIPYVLAWDIQFEGFINWMAWATVSFWTIDIGMNFITGFHSQEGELVMQLGKIAHRYLRTWFLPDSVVVVCDWVSMVMMAIQVEESGTGGLKVLRFAKLGRLFRIMGMLRMLKFARVVEELIEKNLSESYRLALKVLTLFVFTLWLNHLVCCVWFTIGRLEQSDTGAQWTRASSEVGGVVVDFQEQGMLYQYLTAFHWSVSQITLGSIEIHCTNSVERLFNVTLLLLGLLAGSSLVSSFSATMVEFQLAAKERNEMLRMLRQFLCENCTDRRLALMVQQQVTARLRDKDRLTEQNVTALSLLSNRLRAELRHDMFHGHLIRHPLFRLWTSLDTSTVQRLSMEAIEFIYRRAQDDLFFPGVEASKAYSIIDGSVVYVQEPDSAPVQETQSTQVGRNVWLCEAALWAQWIHVGSAQALTHCQFLTIDGDGIAKVLQRHQLIREITLAYCKQFHRRLISATPPSAPWPNDLQVPFTDYGDLVVSMRKEIQVCIGETALDHATSSKRTWGHQKDCKGLEKLKDEVTRGKSTVIINGEGEIERVVSVVALRIEGDDGMLFVQVAKLEAKGVDDKGSLEDAQLTPACQLPGAKQERDELTSEAVQRILDTKLAPLADSVEIQRADRQVEWKESKEYGVRTKYLRTMCVSKLHGEVGMQKCILKPLDLGDIEESSPRTGARFSTHRPMGHTTSTLDSSPKTPTLPLFLDALMVREVYVQTDRKDVRKRTYYAWLTPHEFEYLGGHVGEDTLNKWLSCVQEDTKDTTLTPVVPDEQDYANDLPIEPQLEQHRTLGFDRPPKPGSPCKQTI